MTPQYLLILITALVTSFILTPLAGMAAHRVNAVDYPGGRRIHLVPTPRFGGAAIFAGIIASLVVGSYVAPGVWDALSPFDLRSLALVGTATLITVVGLLDDRRSLPPLGKLIAQTLVAGGVVAAGYRIELIQIESMSWMNSAISVLWITSVMNAVNLIDGLDGLAAGVSLTIALGLLCQSLYYHNTRHALILTAACGAILGFLPFNFRRARIFLGDSGSLLLGLLLAVAAIQGPGRGSLTRTTVVPILALGFPLAELSVTVARRLMREFLVVRRDDKEHQYAFRILGRPRLFTADRDHMHHRLLNRGIGSVRTVLAFYLISVALVAVALVGAVEDWRFGYLLVFVAALFAAVRFFGYSDLQPLRKGLFLPIFGRLSSAPTFVFLCCDIAFAFASLLLALVLYGMPLDLVNGGWWQHAWLSTGGTLVAAQVFGLTLGGLYRQSYSLIGSHECVVMLRSIGFSVMAGLCVIVSLSPHTGVVVLVLDSYVFATLVIGLRLSFGILDYAFQHPGIRRVLVYGANDQGSEAVGAMRANPELRLVPTGFLDDEQGERIRWFRGLRIYRTCDLSWLIRRKIVDELLTPQVQVNGDSGSLEILAKRCSNLGLPLNTFTAHAENQRNGQGFLDVTARSVEMKQSEPPFGLTAK
jgi:UDP-GlcNAc:undecaprenyl-phosphate GlcNAc-1-phosphate transferase